ncbi:predicted protein, partial [Nematostella vectensis]
STFITKYRSDKSVTEPLDKMDFIIMPVLNADGYVYTWTGMRVSKIGVDAIRQTYGTAYRYGSSSNIIYKNSGGSKDYTYGHLNIKYSFALELRDTGRYGFLLPPGQILPTAIETFNGI